MTITRSYWFAVFLALLVNIVPSFVFDVARYVMVNVYLLHASPFIKTSWTKRYSALDEIYDIVRRLMTMISEYHVVINERLRGTSRKQTKYVLREWWLPLIAN